MLTMLCNSRRFVRVIKYLLAGVTVFCVSWIACVNEWNGSIRWTRRNSGVGKPLTTMRTIVAYSEGKQAELDRPSPVTCDRLPAFPSIMQINRTWSPDVYESKWQHVPGTRVSLYAAYYDERQSQHYVRFLAAFHGRNISTEEQLYCQTRSSNPYENSVEVVAAKPLEIWWHEWDPSSDDIQTPLLLSCPLIEPLYGPLVVSVVTEPCNNPTNAFTLESHRKINNYSRKFTICVKDMNFENDVSQNIVEWIEINKILGVEIIDVYVDKINKEIENVLTYYRNEGVIRLFHVPIKYKPNTTLWQRRRDHVLTYNDCLYRNIRESEYVIPLDIDEIILPKIANNWFDLLKRLTVHGWDPKENSAIMIQNVFFFEFLQDINKFKHKNVHNEHKIYTKRDDVRIRVRDDLDLGEIELIGNVKGIESAIIDYRDSDKYKSRCKQELPVPKLARHLVRSAVISPMGYYSKSWMVTKKVLTAFNHYPLASLGAMNFAGWSAPFGEVQLNHYKESCNTTVVGECARYGRRALFDTAALRLRNKLTRALANGYCTGIKNT